MTALPAILVDVRDVGRTYAFGGVTTEAVRHASCVVRYNDRIALVGRSGSGKSTLLHLMAGLDQPSSGSISWPASWPRESLRPEKVGMVFQFPSLVPWLDVAENVALPLQLVGQTLAARDRAMAALRRFDLDHLATKLPEELSGGQAQRVSLVRATVTGPALVLADEPTGQVDHATAAHLMDMLLGWADEEHAAIVVATHDLAVAKRFPTNWQMDRGVILHTDRERLAS
jgi:putative ABC transport system ATP-binding protein/lipoprotein-releasing system ATP-binding protein